MYLLLPHINDASAFHVPTDLLGVTTYIPYLLEDIDLATPVLYSHDNHHICGQRKVTSEQSRAAYLSVPLHYR